MSFIGKRTFETRAGLSGTGTPHKYIEIRPDGEVFFSFVQINQADGTETRKTWHAGAFKRYMRCVFRKWDNTVTNYEITADKIYEVDQHKKRITSEACCRMGHEDMGDACLCEGQLFQEE